MTTYKDILYKKEENETWSEWTNRLDNQEDKLDYIDETIYVYCQSSGMTTARKITDILLELGLKDLIILLENTELLDNKINEAYRVICEAKKPVKPVKTLTVAEMIEALSKLPPDAKLVVTESGFYSDVEFAEVMLPEPYIIGTRKTDYKPDLPDGTKVYRIGHSNQWY
jgi:hypothetical protein